MIKADDFGYDPQAVLRTYDDQAAEYAVKFGSELDDADPADPDREFLDEAAGKFPPGPVLDLGCGPGQVSRYLTGKGRTAIGVDFAPAMLAQAAKLVPLAPLVAADLLALPMRESSCGAAIASYSVHHLPRPLLDRALHGFARVLRPGGILVIITHGGSGEEVLDRPAGQILVSLYSADELIERLTPIGFHPVMVNSRPPRPGEYPASKIRLTARLLASPPARQPASPPARQPIMA